MKTENEMSSRIYVTLTKILPLNLNSRIANNHIGER